MAITKIQSESLNLSDNYDFTGTVTGAGGVMTPSFSAYVPSDPGQNITDQTWTKVQFNTEIYDTDNCYDNSTNYRFTPTTAGKYYITCYTKCQGSGGNTDLVRHYQRLYKNGSQIQLQNLDTRDGGNFRTLSINSNYIVSMNGSSDYLEIYAFADTSGGGVAYIGGGSAEHSFFSAYKIIE